MLIAMRKQAAGWVAKILFGLLILSFAAWGIGDYLTPEADPVVAKVGEIEIRRDTLNTAERRQLEQMRQILGNRFDVSSLPEGALRAAALDQLIGQAALDMETRHLGVAVSEAAIVGTIQSNPNFRSATGNFDANRFRQRLFSTGLSEEAYVSSLRKELARSQLGEAVAVKLPPPKQLAEMMFVLETQTRALATASLSLASVEAPEPTDADIKQYIEANAARFAEPERRDIRALVISVENVARITEVSAADIETFYAANADRFTQPATRTMIQALFSDSAAANNFKTIAPTDAAAFITAAETAGAAVTELGALQQGAIFPAAVGEAVFALANTGPTEALQTRLGHHVVLVSEITPATTVPLDSVRAGIEAQLKRDRANAGLLDVSNAAEDALVSGGDIESASKASGIQPLTFVGLSQAGVDKAGARVRGLPNDPTFLRTVFERQAGEQSGLIELNDSTFVAVIVDKITSSAPKPFDAVKEGAAKAWRAEKLETAAMDRAIELSKAANVEAFVAGATAAGLSVTEHGLKTRDWLNSDSGLPQALVESAFAAQKGTAVQAAGKDAIAIAYIYEIARPNFDPTGEAESEYLTGLTNAYANDRVETLTTVARQANPPEIMAVSDTYPPVSQNPYAN